MNLNTLASELAVLTPEERATVLRMVDEKVPAATCIVQFASREELAAAGVSVVGVVMAIRATIVGCDLAAAKAAYENGRLRTAMNPAHAARVATRINNLWVHRAGTHQTGDWRPASVADVFDRLAK